MEALLIVFICIIVLFAGAVRSRLEWLMNLVMRGILGTIAIYFINMGLGFLGISAGIGINAVTVLTSGILGIPGLLALYLIGFYGRL